MINKFAGSHDGDVRRKKRTTQREISRSLCVFILSRERENKTKSRRRCCPSSPAHGKDEDAGDPEGAAAARQSGFPCPDTNGSNNKRQL